MLLRFFRINDPYRLLGILVILIIITLPLFVDPANLLLDELKMFVLGETMNNHHSLYTELVTSTPPLFALLSSWMEMFFGRSVIAGRLISLFLIFFQLSFFTVMLIKSRAHNENTYLPGLIAGVLALVSFDMLSLSSELVASTILLFALNNLFKEVEFRIQRDEIVLNLGLYIGLASLLVFSYAVYLPGVILLLSIFTRLTLRKSLLVIFGFLIPHSFLLLRYFMKGNLSAVIEHFYLANTIGQDVAFMSMSSLWLIFAVPLLFLLLSLFTLNREARLTKYQSQLSQIMFLWILLAIAEVVISGSLKPHQFITCIPPFSYFISHYMLLIRRKLLAEITLWVFIMTIIGMMYLSRYGEIKQVNYSSLYVNKSDRQIANKRVLILGNEWELFENNRLATGFYEWKLSRPVFTRLDYFDHIVMIDKAFLNDAPDVILDRENIMTEVFRRIPSLQSQYYRQGDLYIKN